jgi:iron complex outermembrane receptor protein
MTISKFKRPAKSLVALYGICAFAMIATSRAMAAGADAAAAEESTAANSTLDEITVTARRKEERLQDVPISVTAVSAETLSTKGIVDLSEFTKVTPALASNSGDTRGTYLWLRGMQGIVPFFADAPFILGSGGQYFDTGSIEVLKGPQGTTFGGSSAGGAIVTNPIKPGESFGGFAQYGTGDYSREDFEGAVDVPFFDGKLLTRTSFQSITRKGYVTDPTTGKDYDGVGQTTARESIIFRPVDGVENYTVVNYFAQRDNGRALFSVLGNYNPNGLLAFLDGQVPGQPGALDSDLASHLPGGSLGLYKTSPNIQSLGRDGETENALTVIDTLRWDINSNISIANIASYRREAYQDNEDVPAIIPFLLPSNDPRAIAYRDSPLQYQHSWSEEIRLTGKALGDRLNYTAGIFSKGYTPIELQNWSGAFGQTTLNTTIGNPILPNNEYAGYGNVEYDFSNWVPGLIAEAGYRESRDIIHNERTDYGGLDNLSTPVEDLPIVRQLSQSAAFNTNAWRAGLRYKFNPEQMVYFTASKGTTPGQVNVTFPPGFQVVQPETLTQLEFGTKSDFDIHGVRVRTNLAAYYGWYNNVQVSVTTLVQANPPPAPKTLVVVTNNAATAHTRGADLDLNIAPVDWFELAGSFAYNDNIFTSWPTVDSTTGQTVDRANSPFIGSLRFKYTLDAILKLPVPRAWGQMKIDTTYTRMPSTVYEGLTPFGPNFVTYSTITLANGYGPAASALGPNVVQAMTVPGFHEWDISASWTDPVGIKGLSAILGVNNLNNNTQGLAGQPAYGAAGWVGLLAAPPRMWTLNLRYSF